jgi:FkbM family methyltransferase
LLIGCEFFAGREPNGSVGSAIFGATPSHPIAREMIERLPASCYVYPVDQLAFSTGPMLLNRVLRDGAWEERPRVRIFPSAFFYPYAGGEGWRRERGFPRAYAAHHWGHSWKGQRGVAPSRADLLPHKGEPIWPSARAFWREAQSRATSTAKKRVSQDLRRFAYPLFRFTKGAAQRVVPVKQTPQGIPWGPGEVLVSTPLGTRLLCPTEDLSIAPELALTGRVDQPFADLLDRWLLRRGMTFVDVGANIGLFTVLGAARVGPGGNVFAYECNPELIGFLRRNIEMNWFNDRVKLIAKAAHRDDVERRLRVPSRLKGLGSLTRFEGRMSRAGGLQEFQVECERLDVGLRDVPYVDLLRIDVEGSDAAVLDGASGLLDEGKVGVIAVQLRGDAQRESREEMEKGLTSLVQDRGASLHDLDDSHPIQLDEVLTVFDYPQLLIRFPGASIEP